MRPVIYKTKPKLKGTNRIVEAFDNSKAELFFLEHPDLKKADPRTKPLLENYLKQKKVSEIWIYYPHLKTIVHTVGEWEYFTLRTARNKNLISESEQQLFRRFKIGIAGLSVGSAILESLVISGGPKFLKIADFDRLEVTNLNRIRARLADVGTNKTIIAATRAWEIDPFAQIELYQEGLTEKNIEKFLLKPRLGAFVDEMDNLALKIRSRLICKEYGIPVLMATDNGDSVTLDVERFDLEPKRKIFHGLISEQDIKNIGSLNYRQWLALATKIVGPEYLTEKMRQSILAIGKTIAAVPQLGASAGMAGASIAFCIRAVSSGEKLPSGRYVISLEEKLDSKFHSKKAKRLRLNSIKKFRENFSL